jgi:predicted Zn-dependent protease
MRQVTDQIAKKRVTMIGNFLSRLVCCAGLGICLTVAAQTDEEVVGKAAAAQVLGAAPLVVADAAQQYVNVLGQAMADISGAAYKWHFGVIKSDAINAFAMPGGYILLSSGLLKSLESEDELAFVLAHEVAHVVRRHHYQVVQRQRLADQAAKGLQAVTTSDTAKLAQASGQIYARGLDKSAEFESDRMGVEYLTRAGYDPSAAINVLEKLQRFNGTDLRAELLFATHPSPAERLDMLLQSGIDKLPRPLDKPNANRQARFQKFLQSI